MSETLGVAVCRLSLDPVRGRIRHPWQVGIAIRAAMFAELSMAGRIVGARWPEAVGDSDLEDPMLNAVHQAVANRRRAMWKRWFSHVDADRAATTKLLVETGRWRQEGKQIVDTQADATLAEQLHIRQQLALKEPPEDLPAALLMLLVQGCGGAQRPAPRQTRKLVKAWLPPHLMTAGRSGDATLYSMIAAMTAIRRVNPTPFVSR
jgi:hypothetical protein